MVQKLLVMERNGTEELLKAIKNDILKQSDSRIITLSVLKTNLGMQAWIVIEVPEIKDKLYKTISESNDSDDSRAVGFEY